MNTKTLIKALTCHLKQLKPLSNKNDLDNVINKHNSFSELLITFFDNKFSPKLSKDEKDIDKCITDIKNYIDNISNIDEKNILSNISEIINAIVRTNYYQDKTYLSFKIDPSQISYMPLIIPYKEIYVYSDDFEGTHLRGGKISRGGIRWSDREDYRTEVLTLLKTQMNKNTVIVPNGAKGIFLIKNTQKDIIECYKDFLRGLLDLTDNLDENNNIISPNNTVIYDEKDEYYLVVAPDKGTALFSNYANEVSKEYNFWLKDAFASGGSIGYNHKDLGITSKGAWISTKHHFDRLKIDIENNPFTVIGIGDMSGDIFGNGMLQSDMIKLIAAFNHKHIFIDPHPDSKTSYEERKRLFNLPKSQWSDYKTLSKGGMIIDRGPHEVDLTDEVMNLLNIKEKKIAAEELIKIILKTQVDLIWIGGIGTYIKSSNESNIDIHDNQNDNVRVNANEIKAKVIVEGGNLGISQKGRIEYAKNGGLINTDFIDNSAGVECSDREVNIKIALNSHKIYDPALRKDLLLKMEEWIVESILKTNTAQNYAISISEQMIKDDPEKYIQLINLLENKVNLNRKIENLSSDEDIRKNGLTRPELAIILSYSKMMVYNEVINSDLHNDCHKLLLNYFPKNIKSKASNHILSKEIISTIISNKIVDELGAVNINYLCQKHNTEMLEIIKTYVIIAEFINIILNVSKKNILFNLEYHIKMIDNIITCIGYIFDEYHFTPFDLPDIINTHRDLVQKAAKILQNRTDENILLLIKDMILIPLVSYDTQELYEKINDLYPSK